jgi:hypothetical protein
MEPGTLVESRQWGRAPFIAHGGARSKSRENIDEMTETLSDHQHTEWDYRHKGRDQHARQWWSFAFLLWPVFFSQRVQT